MILALILAASQAAAQTPARATTFLLTSAGVYVGTGAGAGTSSLRLIADYGVMMNLGQSAIGGSWFVALDANGFSTGPVVRYRRWLTARASLDVAIGTPVANGSAFGSDGLLQPGSVLALAKYNPAPWFGVALRPEYVRRLNVVCDAFTCAEQTTSAGRVYAGAELGELPGVVLTVLGGLFALVGITAIAGS